MSIFSRARLAFSAFWSAFTDPQAELEQLRSEDRQFLYAQAWNYYRNRHFSRRDGQEWTLYLSERELYKHTRLIYNPVPQIVDFYVDNLWQPARDEEFESLVTPVVENTDSRLKNAIAQLDQWSSFLSEAQKIKRYGAATGNVLIEGIDDLEREKILHNIVWPGYVTDLQLNDTGDVQGYTLEYDVTENAATNSRYTFKKQVDKEKVRYFRNGNPWTPPGKTAAVEELPYGFCFAVWIRQTDDGSDYGLPACHNLDKVDEINSLASHLHDCIHRGVESPKVIGANGEIVPIIGASTRTLPDGSTEIVEADPRLNWVVLKADSSKGAVSVSDLASNLKLAESHEYLKDAIESFTDDYPELQAASIIQKNSQLSGAALERMLTPAQNRLDGVQANWNQQLRKFRQMGIAVAGMRYNDGDWQQRTAQQRAFALFDLDSYQAGQLEFNIKRSVLVQNTASEDEELLMKQAQRAKALEGVADRREQLIVAGYTEEEADAILVRVEANKPDAPDVQTGLPIVPMLGEGAVN